MPIEHIYMYSMKRSDVSYYCVMNLDCSQIFGVCMVSAWFSLILSFVTRKNNAKHFNALKELNLAGKLLNWPVMQAVFTCRVYNKLLMDMSRLMGKQTICMGENKDADQLRGNREADQRLCFHYSDSTISLLLKSEISSF